MRNLVFKIGVLINVLVTVTVPYNALAQNVSQNELQEKVLQTNNDQGVDFSNQTVRFIVPYAPGGGTDAWARAVLPYFGKHLPGKPTIFIDNVPGANATKAANLYATQAKPDGLSALITAASNQLSFLMGDSRVRYDFGEWRALMAYSAGVIVYTSDAMELNSIYELIDKKVKNLVFASMGPTSDDVLVLLAFDLLKIDVSSIFGSQGRGPARKLFKRGEANIDFQTTVAYLKNVKPDQDAGRAIPLFTLGSFDDDMTYIRDPQFPDLPNLAEVYEYAHGEQPSGEAWDAWMSLYRAGSGSLKLLVVPKDTPPAVINAYEQAIKAIKADPDYQINVGSLLGVNSVVGVEEASRLMDARTSLPDKHRQWIKSWIFQRYEVRL